MASFPLQDELIEAVPRFAAAKISDPKELGCYFGGSWEIAPLPSLGVIKRTQRELRGWLDNIKHPQPAVNAYLFGSDRSGDEPKFHPRIKFEGRLGSQMWKENEDWQYKITFRWRVVEAPLRAVCALGVVSIAQEGLQDMLKRCTRDGCGNYFVDTKTGGRRKYCLEPECETLRGNARTKKSRGGEK